MKRRLVRNAGLSLLALLAVTRHAHASDYFVGPPGVPAGTGSQAAPFATIRAAAQRVQPGDTVHIHGGTYAESIVPASGGNAGAWVTFDAVAGELPILDANNGSGTGMSAGGTTGYVRFVGIASRRWNSSGFDNGFTSPANHVEYINCIADNNGINGIAFYKATGVLVQNSIVAHNGNQMPSWSSGVNLYTATGTFQDNRVIGNVSFENIDVTTSHSTPTGGATDGSGYILDQNSTGALFENNIGFHNGGSCIRITNSPGAHITNNTCYNDAANPNDRSPSNPAEIFFSQPATTANAVVANNLLVPAGNNMAINATGGAGATFVKNLSVGTAFVSSSAADFRLAATATGVLDQGDTAAAPSTDIGFDPSCITRDATRTPAVVGQPVSWWSYYVDYAYVASVGGVAGCFHPAVRPQGSGPDVGAYESGGKLYDAGATSSSSSGATSGSSGGQGSGSGSAADSGNSGGTGPASGSSGGGGSSGGVVAGSSGSVPTGSSGSTASGSGGTGAGEGGAAASGEAASGCRCQAASTAHAWPGLLAAVVVAAARLGRRRRGEQPLEPFRGPRPERRRTPQ